jgi:hypothetical protein
MNIFELEVRNKISRTTHIQMNDPDGLFQSKRARLLGLVGVAILAILARPACYNPGKYNTDRPVAHAIFLVALAGG